MKQLADGVWQLRGFPPDAINAYLVGDVLVDARTRRARRRILSELEGRSITAHVVTHAHADHQGSSHAVCTELGVPLLASEGDADVIEGKADPFDVVPRNAVTRLQVRYWKGPAHPVERRLREGDEVAGFTVLETPGHTPGHICLWRESDRTLVGGDVLTSMNLVTTRRGLYEPPGIFTPDPRRNREAIRRVAELRPALALFGHGPPWRDPGKLAEFAERLPG